MIHLINVSKNYISLHSPDETSGEIVHAVRTTSLKVEEGEFIAVMGPSGCGKSTLLHIAGGLDKPSQGEVWICGQPIHRMKERDLSLFRRRHTGIIFQFFNLLPQLTASENVALPLRLLGVSMSETDSRTSKLLEEVGLNGKFNRMPSELSGGEQQRVAIARALVHRPHIVLADEPTGNLDSVTSNTILAILKDMQHAYRTTLLLVTHSLEVSLTAHRIVNMQDGLITSKSVFPNTL